MSYYNKKQYLKDLFVYLGVELCSLTSPDDLISSLPEEKYTPVISDDDEEIDIISIVDDKSKKGSVKVEDDACYLPHLSESAQFIKHTVSQVRCLILRYSVSHFNMFIFLY